MRSRRSPSARCRRSPAGSGTALCRVHPCSCRGESLARHRAPTLLFPEELPPSAYPPDVGELPVAEIFEHRDAGQQREIARLREALELRLGEDERRRADEDPEREGDGDEGEE